MFQLNKLVFFSSLLKFMFLSRVIQRISNQPASDSKEFALISFGIDTLMLDNRKSFKIEGEILTLIKYVLL